MPYMYLTQLKRKIFFLARNRSSSRIDKLDRVSDDLVFVFLLAFRRLPTPLGQTPVHQDPRPFAKMLLAALSRATEDHDINEAHVLLNFVVHPGSMRDRQRKLADSQTGGSIAQVGISGQASQKDNLIVLPHRTLVPCGAEELKLRVGFG
jgi:hypothetical protein